MDYDLDLASDLKSLSDAIDTPDDSDDVPANRSAKAKLAPESSLNNSSVLDYKIPAKKETPEVLLEEDDPLAREVALQAALQAARQQEALMRKALEEKERALDDLSNKVEDLGNELEDRERKMDHLARKVEKAQSGETFLQQNNALQGISSSNQLDISELFNADGFDYAPKPKFQWRTIGKVLGGVVALVILGVVGFIMLKRPLIVPETSQPQVVVNQPEQPPISIQQGQTELPVKPEQQTPTQQLTETPKYTVPPPVQDRLRSGGSGPSLVKLPGGTFSMGSKLSFDSKRDEYPKHDVTLKPFYIARYETTFDEYDRFANATGRDLPVDSGFGRDKQPVINVTWDDAVAYVDWLSSETGQNYYLPSEAQWEYATRAYTDTTYWWGNALQKGQAVCFGCGSEWEGSTAPVGFFKPNPFGLYDTIGNVMEWVQDCYNSSYNGMPEDGSPWIDGNCNQHVVRGGAFNKPITMARSTARFQLPRKNKFNMVGFRVARD